MPTELPLLLTPKFLILYAFIGSGLYVHFRGQVRHNVVRQLTDHSTLMAPYNVLMYLFSAVPNRPFLDVERFPELRKLTENWQVLRQEALQLQDDGYIRAASGYNDVGFNSFFRRGWTRFYVKWYDAPLPSAQALCPKTVALVESIPSVNAAMFAVLPPGGDLGRHRDPFAGSLRYHLGLATPNSEHCRIVVDGEPYHWRDGEAVMFDETYIHWAENRTNEPRVILFCDVERPLTNRFIAWVNHWFEKTAIRASQTENIEGDRLGVLNRLFNVLYHLRLVGKALKRRNRHAYYATKWLLLLLVAYLLFWPR
jgi:beta-hydroxylase